LRRNPFDGSLRRRFWLRGHTPPLRSWSCRFGPVTACGVTPLSSAIARAFFCGAPAGCRFFRDPDSSDRAGARIDAVFREALGVLAQADRCEPLCDVLHAGPDSTPGARDNILARRRFERRGKHAAHYPLSGIYIAQTKTMGEAPLGGQDRIMLYGPRRHLTTSTSRRPPGARR
jgi:hypothetical protein